MVDSAVRRRADILFRAHQHSADDEIWTAAERRGEALAMAFRDAAGIQPGSSTNLPPAFTAIVDLPTLEARTGGIATFDGIGPVRGDTARRLACDAKINRLITDGASAILDAGRTTYTPNRAQRRALVARDGGCGWTGCDMPPGWCDAHHIIFWGLEQGPTDIDKLILLCRRHHRLVHEGRWTIERDDLGQVIIHRPDGTLLPSVERSLDAPDLVRERQPTPA